MFYFPLFLFFSHSAVALRTVDSRYLELCSFQFNSLLSQTEISFPWLDFAPCHYWLSRTHSFICPFVINYKKYIVLNITWVGTLSKPLRARKSREQVGSIWVYNCISLTVIH